MHNLYQLHQKQLKVLLTMSIRVPKDEKNQLQGFKDIDYNDDLDDCISSNT